ncbi:MAG: ABC transporter permease subunit [Gammaproteobacteria bacterium]|nr:MAG: ABC transporter permease subunit [Gammaproteobacteria bacterium]
MPDSQASILTTSMKRHRWRRSVDRLATISMGLGGGIVIVAIVMIFFYLLYVVAPIFAPADMKELKQYSLPAATAGKTLLLAIEEQNEVALRLTDRGQAVFFKTGSGEVILTKALLGDRASPSSFAIGRTSHAAFAYGLTNGRVVVARHVYNVTYPDDQKLVTPKVEYPLGQQALRVDTKNRPLLQLALEQNEEQTTIVAFTDDKRLILVNIKKEENLLDEEVATTEITRSTLANADDVKHMLIDPEQQILYTTSENGRITVFDIRDKAEPTLLERKRVVPANERITNFRFLTGGISLLIVSSEGVISQWFPVRSEDNTPVLTRIREFEKSDRLITDVDVEQRRKGFITADERGNVRVFHATAKRLLLDETISENALTHVSISPRSDRLLAEDIRGQIVSWQVNNEHPEISWAVLWGKVWYESYKKPSFTWQSSSASNDFEPKYSLVPLSFGTLKAAFYAMLFAIPLSIMGAIYTAYFMAPAMRAYVKPTIEIMEALPTVILGFLAGLWLAPLIEHYLPGVFLMLIVLPIATFLFGYAYHCLPGYIRNRIPEGWDAALLIPVLLLSGWLAMGLSQPTEQILFNGNMRLWLSTSLGLDFDQRNSLVVGIAMGIAVIPTIFSITEDAIFSVPKHLTLGSLALGATPWQSLVRVVLLTASPGIFSAIMIGMGRAVGETMIVLMATGNTPVMDFSIFQGMRTLAANIAVEIPETEVGSTHYRVLFLAALVLFMFTFAFNTVAELVRQRLRRKYSSL